MSNLQMGNSVGMAEDVLLRPKSLVLKCDDCVIQIAFSHDLSVHRPRFLLHMQARVHGDHKRVSHERE